MIVCTFVRKQCLGFYNVITEEIEMYHPEHGWGSDFPDAHNSCDVKYDYRLNCLGEKDDVIYFLVYNSKTGYRELHGVNIITREPVETKKYYCNTKHSHGIMIRRGQFLTLDNCGMLQGFNDIKMLVKIPNGYKVRGMAGDDMKWACSFHTWNYQGTGSYISTYDFTERLESDGPPKKIRYADGIGSVNDMRRIDGVDFCHRNPYDFPYTGF